MFSALLAIRVGDAPVEVVAASVAIMVVLGLIAWVMSGRSPDLAPWCFAGAAAGLLLGPVAVFLLVGMGVFPNSVSHSPEDALPLMVGAGLAGSLLGASATRRWMSPPRR